MLRKALLAAEFWFTVGGYFGIAFAALNQGAAVKIVAVCLVGGLVALVLDLSTGGLNSRNTIN